MLFYAILICTASIIFLGVLSHWLLERSKTKYIPFSRACKLQFSDEDFPKPGECIAHNFGVVTKESNDKIRFTSLNMERGKQMDKVVQQLLTLNPDIIFLQEVDYYSRRSGRIDQAGELAQLLQMNSFWVCEFVIKDPCDLKDNLNLDNLGCEGNAILSKFPLVKTKAILLDCQQIRIPGHRPFKTHAEAFGIVQISENTNIAICSAHLDPHYTGKLGRKKQYTQLVQKLIPYMKKYPTVIAGDFNTVCTGIGRVNIPKISPDFDSFIGSLGKSEALVFQNNAVLDTNQIIKTECDKILEDPFNKQTDTTFSGMSGLFNAKLDWCLLSSEFYVTSHVVGNKNDQLCSDHMWITVDAKIN